WQAEHRSSTFRRDAGRNFGVPERLCFTAASRGNAHRPMRLGQGVSSNNPAHFPQSVSMIRLHDSGIRWGLISPARGVYNFAGLDQHLSNAEKAGVDVIYCVSDTPAYAAVSKPAVTGAYGIGSNALPDLTMLSEFITALMKHCQRA